MREELIELGADKTFIAEGLAGYHTTFVWQLNKNKSFSKEFVSKEVEREPKYLSEEKILDKLEEYIKLGADKGHIAEGLAGLDSDRAWKMREEFIELGADKEYIAVGLAGLDSDRAWKMRDGFIELGVYKRYIAEGLAGLDSDRAWKMREEFINSGADKDYIAISLAGVDSDRAWKMREEFIESGVEKENIAQGLAGLDSDRAWKMREELIELGADKTFIAEGLAGLNSDRAWKMREEFINSGADKDFIAVSLAGLNSDRAWKMREELLNLNANKGDIALGLAGLDSDRAWKMREEFIELGADKGNIASGLAGYNITFVWQLNKKNKEKEKTIVSSSPKKEKNEFDADKLYQEISLYLENDSLLAENDKKSPTQKIRSSLSTGKNLVMAMGTMFKEAPSVFLNTLSAKKDERNLTRKLARRVFPSMFLEKENNWRGFSGYSGLNEGRSRSAEPRPQDYLNPDAPQSMLGGNPEGGSGENQEVLHFREPVSDLIITGIYGKLDGQSWDPSYQFPISKSTMEKAKEITITLPSVGSKVKLPKLINSNIIFERVRGIKNKEESPLEVEISPMREGAVRETKKAEEIIYSIEIDELPKKILEISSDEYVTFKEQFIRANGPEMSKTLVELPAEIDLFLSSLKNKNPKEQVQEIEIFVRSICYYDMKNGEMINLKQGKDLAERLEIMEARVEELKASDKNKSENLAGKKYAGVCADFAVLTAAILRQAGFSSGVLAGFMPDGGKSVTVDQAHATAFVVWPNAKKENEIFSVDGTPNGVIGVSRPSLVEQESSREEKIKEIEAEAESQLEEIMKTLDSLDADAIKELTNGKLESALNTILRYGVEAENLKVIKTILEAYWYSPLHKYDLNETDDQIKFLKFFENEVNRARQEAPVEREADPGSKLFETVELFTQRFSKEGDMKKAFVILEKINDLASRSLSSNEKKALTATITYLEAKKVKAS